VITVESKCNNQDYYRSWFHINFLFTYQCWWSLHTPFVDRDDIMPTTAIRHESMFSLPGWMIGYECVSDTYFAATNNGRWCWSTVGWCNRRIAARVTSPHRVTGTQVKTLIANRTFETVEQLKYLETKATNQSYLRSSGILRGGSLKSKSKLHSQRRAAQVKSGNLGLLPRRTSILYSRNNLKT
jgi:hypothetical protein